MRKARKIILLLVLFFSTLMIIKIATYYNYIKNNNHIASQLSEHYEISNDLLVIKINPLRAGGGSSGGSGSSSGSGYHGRSGSSSNGRSNPFVTIITFIFHIILFSIASIVVYTKILRFSINSKRYLRLLEKDDPVWNYKNIEKQVITTYYNVQEAWSKQDLSSAKEFMDEDLYNAFEIKINWMIVGNKKNILKKIKLINLKPISLHDDEDNEKDLIWFYIRGYMIDYTINTETNEKIEGSLFPLPFTEYWKFKRTNDDRWVLAKICQSDELDKIL